ncbi:unnamed protein product [Polarella glacialis]|uniref:Uncharacterized protein n=1 Tax=Polarella glacialis TaxID=89957 RepID=A0A813DD51_POLGL|nr:unnamed protein product [Polarella glacialis]
MAYSDPGYESEDQIDYFEGTEGLVQVFEFDYDKTLAFRWDVANKSYLAMLPLPCCCCCAWSAMPCWCTCAKPNMEDAIRCQHVCVTQDGIRYVEDKHKTGCRLDCQDSGKVTKTVPFDKLTDCDIEEPAGASGPICCMVDNVLYKVNIDTASSGGSNEAGVVRHEMILVGLKDPHGFKSMVWAMKRSGAGFGAAAMPAPAQATMAGLQPLLTRQNELLEENNKLLRQIAANTSK